jgi:glycosyltransferase involved in cell wall biosynthesis
VSTLPLVRVLHVQKARGIGGSERHLLDLLGGLPTEGVDPRMLTLCAPGSDVFTEALDDRRIRHLEVTAGPDANPALVRRIHREIRVFGADLVHTHLVHADVHGQLAARWSRVPGIASMHGVHAFFRREPVRTAERAAMRSARRVIAISEHVASYLVKHRLVPAGRIRVVPYGIDADRWRLSDDDRREERARYGLDDHAFVIGMVSRLVRGKGHRVAFEAARRAASRNPRLHLLVAGTGPLAPLLEEEAARSAGEIRMLGFVEDVRSLMAACDVVVVPTEPSLGEGFGLAALEAMAAGRATIVTRVASLPEVVGDVGVVVPPEDPAALADAIVALARDPAEAQDRASRGQARARERFSLQKMVGATADVYREVV